MANWDSINCSVAVLPEFPLQAEHLVVRMVLYCPTPSATRCWDARRLHNIPELKCTFRFTIFTLVIVKKIESNASTFSRSLLVSFLGGFPKVYTRSTVNTVLTSNYLEWVLVCAFTSLNSWTPCSSLLPIRTEYNTYTYVRFIYRHLQTFLGRFNHD